MQSRTGFRVVGLLGLVAGIVVCCGGLAVLFYFMPALNEQLPAGSAPLVAHITAPTAGDAPAGQVIRVQASATSANPITELQLWVNGAHIASQTAPADTRSARMSFDWLPDAVGANLVIVRAVDAKGYSADSAPLRLNIGAPATNTFTSPLAIPSDEGDTLTSIADSLGVPREVVYAANPNLPTDDPLPAESAVIVPLDESYDIEPETAAPSPTLPPPAEPSIPAEAQPAPSISPFVPITFYLASFGALPELPAAPELVAKQNGCTVDVTIIDASDDETGFFLYEMSPGAPGFERVGEFGASSGAITTSRPAQVGSTIYKAAAFNSAGEAQSDLVSVQISDATCGMPDLQLVVLEDAQITLNEPADRAYCYASPDSIHWVRLPEGDDTFYTPSNNVIDLADDIGPIGAAGQAHTLSLECWGWSAGALKSLGAASGAIPDTGDVEIIAQAYKFTATSEGSFPYGGLPLTVILPAVIGFAADEQTITPPINVVTQLADNGSARVSWQWIKLGCVPDKPCDYIWDIDGFKVYDHTGALVATAPANQLAAPATDQGGGNFDQCYTVTAYQGDKESKPSAPACMQPPSAHPPHSVIDPYLAPPINVTLTGDGAVCFQHLKGFLLQALFGALCDQAAANNQHILVWDWYKASCFGAPDDPCNTNLPTADGFTVYVIENGRPYLVDVIDSVEQTAAIVPESSTGGAQCFMVRAYRGFYESVDSMSTCGAPVPPQQVSAEPSTYVTFLLQHIKSPGAGFCIESETNSGWSQHTPDKQAYQTLRPGFLRINDKGGCNTWVTNLEAGGVAFRIDNWADYPIEKAVFEFEFKHAMTLYKGQSIGADTSWDEFAATCLTRVTESDTALQYWYEDNLLSTGPFSSERGAVQSYDVTELLKQRIAQGNQVIRFVLAADQSVAVDHPGEIEICWSRYENFRLNVTFGDLQ